MNEEKKLNNNLKDFSKNIVTSGEWMRLNEVAKGLAFFIYQGDYTMSDNETNSCKFKDISLESENVEGGIKVIPVYAELDKVRNSHSYFNTIIITDKRGVQELVYAKYVYPVSSIEEYQYWVDLASGINLDKDTKVCLNDIDYISPTKYNLSQKDWFIKRFNLTSENFGGALSKRILSKNTVNSYIESKVVFKLDDPDLKHITYDIKGSPVLVPIWHYTISNSQQGVSKLVKIKDYVALRLLDFNNDKSLSILGDNFNCSLSVPTSDVLLIKKGNELYDYVNEAYLINPTNRLNFFIHFIKSYQYEREEN